MNCNDVSTILDERREARLTPAEHCAVDAHLSSCDDCARAWHAQAQLRALPIPSAPAELLARVLAARSPYPHRRATPRIVLGLAILAGGAALAAMTYVTLRERAAGDTALLETAPEPVPPPSTGPAPAGDSGAGISSRAGVVAPSSNPLAADRSLLPDSEYFLVSRQAPDYPPGPLERGENGTVLLEFTITDEGRVADAVAVEPSDAAFVPSAVAAVAKWTYLPRVIDGERVAVHDVRTVVRFQLTGDEPPPPRAAAAPPTFVVRPPVGERLHAAWRCLSVHELRCAELILDELVATHQLTPKSSPNVWDFYGYLYTQYGDYGRAIAAYEAAVENGGGWGGEWLALAHLYFARNQYDMAMRTLLRYKEKNGDSVQLFPGTEAFIEKLRLLGISEEAL
jgi:TonB family protein